MWQTFVSMQSLLEIWCSTCLAVHFVAGVHEALWLAQSIWNVLFFQLPKDTVKAHTFARVLWVWSSHLWILFLSMSL